MKKTITIIATTILAIAALTFSFMSIKNWNHGECVKCGNAYETAVSIENRNAFTVYNCNDCHVFGKIHNSFKIFF